MSTPPLELCFKLGYHEGLEGLPSRGPPGLLLDDLKFFAEKRAASGYWCESLGKAYLASAPQGLKHYPLADSSESRQLLLWPRDRVIITNLVSQLFAYIMQNRTRETQIIDLEDYEDVGLTLPNNGGVAGPSSNSQVLQAVEPGQRATEAGLSKAVASQVAGPIARLAEKDPDLIWNLLDAGHTEPFPAIGRSEEELINIISEWMDAHPGKSTPGTRALQTSALGRIYEFKVGITFDTTSEEVYAEQHRVGPSLMAWVLTDASGSCMLVKPALGNSGQRRRYYAWLGGELGFTEKAIASSDGYQSPNITQERRAESTTLESARENHFGGAEGDKGAALYTRSKPTQFRARQVTLKGRQKDRQTEEQRWTFDSLHDSSPELGKKSGKKRRWPPQYVSPPPTSQRKRPCFQTPQGQKHTLLATTSPDSGLGGSSSAKRHMSRLAISSSKSNGTYTLDNVFPKYLEKPVKTKPKPQEEAKSPGSPASPPPDRKTITAKDIIFHFFLADESLGAVPITISQCNTVASFFAQALSAWNFSGDNARSMDFSAVSVVMEGALWPTVVPWHNVAAFQGMVDAVSCAKASSKGDLQVQVKCIKTE